MISYEPHEVPDLPSKLTNIADKLHLHVVHVICVEPGAKIGDANGVAFFTMTPFIPRNGDRIQLEDGNACLVRGTYWKITRMASDVTMLVATVYAERLETA